MDTETFAIVCAVLAILVTPLWIVLMVKGVRTLDDLRDLMRGPVRPRSADDDRGDVGPAGRSGR